MQKHKSRTLRAGVWPRVTAAWCSRLQCSAPGQHDGCPGSLGLSNRDHRMQCVEYTNIQAILKKGQKKPRKKVLLNLFLSWRLQAPVAEFEGKQGCLASWEFLAGREMTWRSSLSFISPDHRSQISQGSSALALLPPVQVPLGPTQKPKYYHHVFTLNQFSVLTSCSDWAQSPGCCQIFGYLNPSSQFFC